MTKAFTRGSRSTPVVEAAHVAIHEPQDRLVVVDDRGRAEIALAEARASPGP